jgi:hypothetical protein
MSPLPQEGTVLEWTRHEYTSGGGLETPPETDVWWEASGTPYSMLVEGGEGEARWSVEDLSDGAKRKGVEFTVEKAKLAAESAARDLLCGALAAFAGNGDVCVRPCRDWRGGFDIRDERGSNLVQVIGAVSREDCRRLALALLKASKEPTP